MNDSELKRKDRLKAYLANRTEEQKTLHKQERRLDRAWQLNYKRDPERAERIRREYFEVVRRLESITPPGPI
jgi:hypothetical protein